MARALVTAPQVDPAGPLLCSPGFLEACTALSDITAGDIVECIDDTPSRPESQIMPDMGGLYIVTSIRPVSGGRSVRLKELTPTCHLGGICGCGDCGWDAGRFRKVYRPNGEFIASLFCDVPDEVEAPELVD